MKQVEFTIGPYKRGFHVITELVKEYLGILPEKGLLFLFIKHTSAGLCINENYDSDVLGDFESFFNFIVPENQPFLKHTTEGSDDMPAHIKSVLTGSSIVIPISKGNFNLGTWQGIYLCEFRNHGGKRKLVATIL